MMHLTLPSLLHVWKHFFAQEECGFQISFKYLHHTVVMLKLQSIQNSQSIF